MIEKKTNQKACPEDIRLSSVEAPRRRVMVAMSGGVDSSVAAALLKKNGFNVEGIFMRLNYFSKEAEERSRKVAKILNIPFRVLDLRNEFKKTVIEYFLDGYKKGITPNPCVVCNKEIKFKILLKEALRLKADFVATGHYAGISQKSKTKSQNYKSKLKSFKLLKARDTEKDQSYFLWKLSQNELKHILFPVGNYTRKEVEKLARKFGLPFSGIQKSVEVCFIPDANIAKFLKARFKSNNGKIIETNGQVIGQHQGLFYYTIGQRKGIKLSGGPYYVADKDIKKKILIVSKNKKDLLKKELDFKSVNWISGRPPRFPLKIKAKIRYRSQFVSAVISKLDAISHKLTFVKPQRAITPGQSVVFYKDEELLGGGIIC